MLTDEQGKIVGAMGTFTDLTALVLAHERIAILEERTKSHGAFQQMVGKGPAMAAIASPILQAVARLTSWQTETA